MAATLPPVQAPVDFSVRDNTSILALLTPLCESSSRANELIALGAVYRNRTRVLHTEVCVPRDLLRVHLAPRRFETHVEWKSRLVAESEDWIVIDKPAGLPIHPTCDNERENVQRQLECLRGEALWICHRLDIGTSGLVVFAKNLRFRRHFNRLLEAARVQKRYRAWVEKDLSIGTYRHFQPRRTRAPFAVQNQPTEGARECRLSILETSVTASGWTEVIVDLHTGRPHQIRAQLAALGAPVVGDLLYGSSHELRCPGDGERFALQSSDITFEDLDGSLQRFGLPPSELSGS